METVACALCGRQNDRLILQTPDREYGLGEIFYVVQCQDCGLVYVNPRPTEAELPTYYPTTYYVYAGAHGHQQTASQARAAREYYSGRLKQLACNLPAVSPGRLLDVGCGDGHFLFLMQEQGWDAIGVEISERTAQFASNKYGLSILPGQLGDARLPGRCLDLVTFWHSLEHVPDPRLALLETHRILRKDGYVVVQVPNIATILFRVFGRYYSMLQVPRHLYHFGPRTLQTMLSLTGFQVVSVVYSPGVNGLVESIKCWWRVQVEKGSTAHSGTGNRAQETSSLLRRKVIRPSVRLMGRVLAITRNSDVFTVYAVK